MTWLAASSGLLFAALMLIVDPLIAGTPWWAEPGLWVPLAFPLLPWLGVAGAMAWLGSAATSWLHALVFSFIVLAVGVIPGFFGRFCSLTPSRIPPARRYPWPFRSAPVPR
ncbi:hypothetical protein [Glutamicibacter arilaitensis]|uniref:hypothetical protein n=1 Tax=Glutamicibacter arilaitensis TaxID=256701 RepID=UPI000ECA2F57|nr:hypothetical protein [Glutamicibacter sp.]